MNDLHRGIKLLDSPKEYIYIEVRKATLQFRYSEQYLRKLLRNEKLHGIKIGQIWLIAYDSLLEYIKDATITNDFRFGPRVKNDEVRTF
jgi:hypothetical protein